MSGCGWFDVDRKGLAKLIRQRGLEFVVFELVQNAWDQQTSRCDVTLTAIEGRPLVELVVTDDDPEGFADIRHAFTLFAESTKKGDVEKRGRFNLGEKLVLAVCEEARIITTTGGVGFGPEGRSSLRTTRERGSEFRGVLRMTRQEMGEIEHAMSLLIAPMPTTFNGQELAPRRRIASIEVTLPTIRTDSEGQLRPTRRRTRIDLYEPLPGEPARLYELGIPICETGDRWDVDVAQKVPLSMDRSSVTDGYLREIRVAALNAAGEQLTQDEARAPWVQVATNHPDAQPGKVLAVTRKRFGERFVDYDPTDKEANGTAFSNGCAVIPSRALGKQERAHLRGINAIQPAGQLYPTHPDKRVPSRELTDDEDTPAVRRLVAMYERLGEHLVDHAVRVVVHHARGSGTLADYDRSTATMRLNLANLGIDWFERSGAWPTRDQLDLLVHELGHDAEADHTSHAYHSALTRLGARLAYLALISPNLFS
jgi:hypothetical protein